MPPSAGAPFTMPPSWRRPPAPSPALPVAGASRQPLASGVDADVTERRGDAAPGRKAIAALIETLGASAPATAAATLPVVTRPGAAVVASSEATRGDAPPSRVRSVTTQQAPTPLFDDGVHAHTGVRRTGALSPPGAERQASPAKGAPHPPVSPPSSDLTLSSRLPAATAPAHLPGTLRQPRRPRRHPLRRHRPPMWPFGLPRHPPRPRQRGRCGG